MSRSVAVLVDDLAWWIDAGMQPTGIQRVAFGVLDAILARDEVNAWPAMMRDGQIVAIDRGTLERRSETMAGRALTSARASVVEWPIPAGVRSVVKRAYHTVGQRVFIQRPTRSAPPPDLVVVPGAFWAGDWWRDLSNIADHHRVRVIVYDLFPLTNPEWVVESLESTFRDSTRSILPKCDRIVAFGETPAAHVTAVYPDVRPRMRVAVPELSVHGPDSRAAPAAIIPDPYLLVVGTVEPRKNVRTILNAWVLARPRLGFGSLVIAGRRGWETEDLEAEIDLDRDHLSLVRLDDVSDERLEALYEGAAATVHASWAEGFGLPARESIARGVPALMSSAIPRDGLRDGFSLFDPTDDARLAELMVDALRSPVRLKPSQRNGLSGWEPVVAALLDD